MFQTPVCTYCKEEGEAHHKHTTVLIRTFIGEAKQAIEAHCRGSARVLAEAELENRLLSTKLEGVQYHILLTQPQVSCFFLDLAFPAFLVCD